VPQTPDRHPGPLIEDQEIRLVETADAPSTTGAINYSTSGSFQMKDASGTFDPRTGGGGLTPSTHRALDQLVHEIAETSYTEVVETAGKVTAVIVWTDSGKTTKIREEEYTYTGGQVTTIVTKQYDGTGTLVETYTETVTYSGGKVQSISGVLS
jgi:hypothetical protein